MEHAHTISTDRSGQRRALWVALAATGLLMVGEAVGGLAFHSLALLADAVHLLTDVSGLAIAVVALRLAERPATSRLTFGMLRAEVLAAQGNGIVLLAVSGWIVYEAIHRLAHPAHVSGTGLAAVAATGLVVNLGSASLLGRAAGRSLNMRGAFLHLASDALGSLGALGAGISIVIWDNPRVDAAVSLVISALVLWAAWRLLRETTHVLLEGAPRGMDPDEVERAIATYPQVQGVHHLHVWNLASDVPALSAHVVLPGSTSMHEAQMEGEGIKSMLAEHFGIDHVTLELECHGHEGHQGNGIQ